MVAHLTQRCQDRLRLSLLDAHIIVRRSVRFRYKSLPRFGKALRQKAADTFAGTVRVS